MAQIKQHQWSLIWKEVKEREKVWDCKISDEIKRRWIQEIVNRYLNSEGEKIKPWPSK